MFRLLVRRLEAWVTEKHWRTWVAHGGFAGAVVGVASLGLLIGMDVRYEAAMGISGYYFFRELVQIYRRAELRKELRPPVHDHFLDVFVPLVVSLIATAL